MSAARAPGRRPGSPEVTRAQILSAAREAFGASGFERATIRAIGSGYRARPRTDAFLISGKLGPWKSSANTGSVALR